MHTPNADLLIRQRLGEAEEWRYVTDMTITLSDLTPEEDSVVLSQWGKKRKFLVRGTPARVYQWRTAREAGSNELILKLMIDATEPINKDTLKTIVSYLQGDMVKQWIGRKPDLGFVGFGTVRDDMYVR